MSPPFAAHHARGVTLVCLVIASLLLTVGVGHAAFGSRPAHPAAREVVASPTTRAYAPRAKYPVHPSRIPASGGELYAYPPRTDTARPITVVYLHGIHGKPENGCPWLRQGASELGWLVCPRANADAELPGTFSWGGSAAAKMAVVADAVRSAEAQGAVAGARPVVVGFSQGAYVALELLDAKLLRPRGVVLVSAEVEPKAATLVAAGVEHVVLASGELDAAYGSMRRAAARLRLEGIDASFVSLGRVGHTYVADDPASLAEAIRAAGGQGGETAPRG